MILIHFLKNISIKKKKGTKKYFIAPFSYFISMSAKNCHVFKRLCKKKCSNNKKNKILKKWHENVINEKYTIPKKNVSLPNKKTQITHVI